MKDHGILQKDEKIKDLNGPGCDKFLRRLDELRDALPPDLKR